MEIIRRFAKEYRKTLGKAPAGELLSWAEEVSCPAVALTDKTGIKTPCR